MAKGFKMARRRAAGLVVVEAAGYVFLAVVSAVAGAMVGAWVSPVWTATGGLVGITATLVFGAAEIAIWRCVCRQWLRE